MNHRPSARSAAAPVTVFVSAGSNVQPAKNIRMALQRLRHRFGPLTLSSVYRNKAAGFAGDDFLNLVIGFTTSESPDVIIEELERLHDEAGRVRGPNAFAPRTLDLDLLLYGDHAIEEVKIPRPDIVNCSFVLGPLAELAPNLRHPITGETMAQLWGQFDQTRHPLERLPIAII